MSKIDIPAAGAPLPKRMQLLSKVIQCLYFRSVNLVNSRGQPIQPLSDQEEAVVPIIFYISHRNGAMDGYTAQKLHATASSMLSIQLVAHPYLKWFFSGIPVLRDKDRERFAHLAKDLSHPIMQSIRHVEAGGSLFIYPEGSSEWGHTHLPYQAGGAKIIRHLISKGKPFEVRAVGLFYVGPDQFRSDVDVVVSDPIQLLAQNDGESTKAWEARIFEQLNGELEGVSVHCRDPQHLQEVSQYAKRMSQSSGFYGTHFIQAQQQAELPVLNEVPVKKQSESGWFSLFCTLYFMLVMSPVLLGGWLAGKKADAINTVSFFKTIATAPLLLVWSVVIVALAFSSTLFMASLVLAAIGFYAYPNVKPKLFRK